MPTGGLVTPLLFVISGLVLLVSGYFLDDALPESYLPDACVIVGFCTTFFSLAFWVLS